jgi:hypothetical protein
LNHSGVSCGGEPSDAKPRITRD